MECYMTIFDYYNFSIKKTIPVFDKEINIDEETNAVSTVKTTVETDSKKKDIVVIKENGRTIFLGIIKEVSNENNVYTYSLLYITNLFDSKILLEQNAVGNVEEGYYRLKPVVDGAKSLKVKNNGLESGEKVVLWDKNSIESQVWKIEKDGTHFKFKNILSDKYMSVEDNAPTTNGKNIIQSGTPILFDIIEKNTGQYNIAYASNNNYVIDVEDGVSANGTKIQIWENSQYNEGNRLFYLEKTVEPEIWIAGIEDFIANTINDNYINNEDEFTNLPYLDLEVKTHTKKNTSISNVENGIYNLHTFINNCTQNYDIMYNFSIAGNRLKLTIENKTLNRKLLNEEMIVNVEEVFETDIVSKVLVNTSSGIYELYLLNDRSTTTDKNNENRAEGRTEVVYTENMEDAEQEALNTIKQNNYNHNVSFESEIELEVGQPISIRTEKSIIYDTYISAKSVTDNKFIKYTCGNIRVNFLDKIKKERKK